MSALTNFICVINASPNSIIEDVLFEADVSKLILFIRGSGQRITSDDLTLYPATPSGKQEALADANQRLSSPIQESSMSHSPTGYIIRKHQHSNDFFTSKSAYDKPDWVGLKEATIFHSAESAEKAVKKLWMAGSMAAQIVNTSQLSESRTGAKAAPQKPAPAKKALECPYCGKEHDELDAECCGEKGHVEKKAVESAEAHHISIFAPKQRVRLIDDGAAYEVVQDTGIGNVSIKKIGEDHAQTIVVKAQQLTVEALTEAAADAQSVEFKDANVVEPEDKTSSVAASHEDAFNVPAGIASAIKAVVTDFQQKADESEGVDAEKTSFALTVVDAAEALLADLDLGTTAGFKAAQIKLASYMSPITNQFPSDVILFILQGGPRLSLKSLFDEKWAKTRGSK